MELTNTHKLILYSLGQFYQMLNQPLVEKPLKLSTMKITFIELLLKSMIISQQERALYKNLEFLESKKLITYENRMIKLTESGLKELQKIEKELQQFLTLKDYFLKTEKPKRKLQTVISN